MFLTVYRIRVCIYLPLSGSGSALELGTDPGPAKLTRNDTFFYSDPDP
jgi:hypothetical protein